MANFTKPFNLSSIDMTSNYTSEKIDIADIEIFSVQAIWSSADDLSGNARVYLQASNDGTNWAEFDPNIFDIRITAAADNCLINTSSYMAMQWLRIQYEAGINTAGTLAIRFLGKSLK